MDQRIRRALVLIAGLLVIAPALPPTPARAAQPPAGLTVVGAGPTGEVESLAQAREIRVVFSEPMISLGRIPSPLVPVFFHLTPAVKGAFRWSGTTILVFTPDPKAGLPYSTRFEVTIDAGAQALSGRRLAQPYTFVFVTPTVKLLRPAWYRRGGKVDQPILVALRFNQPVRAADVLAHATARFQPHAFSPPTIADDLRPRLAAIDRSALDRFAARTRAAAGAASASGPVGLRLALDWDKRLYPPDPALVVLETATTVPPESWVQVQLDAGLPSPAGPASPGRVQQYVVEAERAFFVDGFECQRQCDPERHNPVRLRRPVPMASLARSIGAIDITTPGREAAVRRPARPGPRQAARDTSARPTLEDAGLGAQPPASTYLVTIDAGLESTDGQTLGYTWIGSVENWHRSAFISFGAGHGVWESSGGPVLPFHARNFESVTEWAQAVPPASLMSLVKQQEAKRFELTPPGAGDIRRLGQAVDRTQSYGLDMSKALSKAGTGLVWAAVEEGKPMANARTFRSGPDVPNRIATLVQATNLGITVKDSPQNTLVFVTRLDTGAPVPGAKVSIIRLDETVFWTGTTGADGAVIAPDTPLRGRSDYWDWDTLAFIVTAEKDGDLAYACSNWNEGISPWTFGTPFSLAQASPVLVGSVFTDRGVYKSGEEVHVKAVLRQNAPGGVEPLPEGASLWIATQDGRGRRADERVVKVGKWSSVEWTLKLPADAALGSWGIHAALERDRPGPSVGAANRAPGDEDQEPLPWGKMVDGDFLVAAYRRPDFRVDVTLSSDQPIAGALLKGTIGARYLFGAPMGGRPVTWTLSRSPVYEVPQAVYQAFDRDRWVFVGRPDEDRHAAEQPERAEASLTRAGDLSLDLKTRLDAGVPMVYTLEGDVEDVSRQHIAGRAQVTVHPAPWYIGLRRPSSFFVPQKDGLSVDVVAAAPDGRTVTGVPVELVLSQVQWKSVRQAEGDGFYSWESRRELTEVGRWSVTTGDRPVPFHAAVPSGGSFLLRAAARDGEGRSSVTTFQFYALGEGYTAWRRYDHNRIDLVPERTVCRPGDTARVMIQSPWERATALVTTEREGVRSHREFALTSTQQTVEIPITEADIPNLYVSVLLVKGRTKTTPPIAGVAAAGPASEEDAADPGKPSFRLGYAALDVESRVKRLSVAVAADQVEYRPAGAARVSVEVSDARSRGAAGEVTLWAVDYGVLSLTGYAPPDLVDSVYVHKALQVLNEDSRERIVSRRVLTPKGDTPGGGGGEDAGAGVMRRDFRALAFWLGSVVTGPDGKARVEVTLPESLTTYRIMAVAADLQSRFGSGSSEIRVNKPVTLKAAFPRFLAVGDRASFGAVVTSQLKSTGAATVTFKSLDPGVLQVTGTGEQSVTVPGGGSLEVRFDAAGRAIGRARVQAAVRIGDQTDAFEEVVPVEVLAAPEMVAAYGQADEAKPAAREALTIPAGVVPGYGGLHVELSSTAMVGLREGARYLADYPHGCAEQKASRALAVLLAADLGGAFRLPGLDAATARSSAQDALNQLAAFQCERGGFAFWPGQCSTASPYLTSYVLHVLHVAAGLGYTVDGRARERALAYLEKQLGTPPPQNEGWWPSYTAWQAYAVKVLAEDGRVVDSHIARLYAYRDRMPVFALAYLLDALAAGREASGPRGADLRRRIANATLIEAGSAHVEESSDPYLLWFWNSNVRSTAIALGTLAKMPGGQAPVRGMVQWLLAAQRNGRWDNTQENALAMEALVAYYRAYEANAPDFRAVVTLGAEHLASAEFKGRSTTPSATDLAMPALLAKGKAGETLPLTFARLGAGTLFYATRFSYAADRLYQQGLDNGILVERTYEPYVEAGQPPKPASLSYKAGDLVRVTLTLTLTKERRFVALTDPLPAGFEPIESWLATTVRALAVDRGEEEEEGGGRDGWLDWWRRGGFDHVERHDDRVLAFATRLSEGRHEFTYVVRATTAGTFRTAPAHAEQMYEPEVFGRTGTAVVEVKP